MQVYITKSVDVDVDVVDVDDGDGEKEVEDDAQAYRWAHAVLRVNGCFCEIKKRM